MRAIDWDHDLGQRLLRVHRYRTSSSEFHIFARRNGFAIRFHDLRHTHASNLLGDSRSRDITRALAALQ